MRLNIVVATAPILALTLLSACQVADDKQQTAQKNDSDPVVATAEPAAPMVVEKEAAPAAPVIATQPGPDGSTVDLNKVAVTGQVLTIQVTVKPKLGESAGLYMDNDEISIIDDATSQRYSLLKDNEGKVMASPLSGSNQVGGTVSRGGSEIYWFKFPAPPATSQTISINLPKVAPFDGVAVTR